MTIIKQLKEMPDGYKTGGFMLTVKKFKKKYLMGKKWIQQLIFADDTGEIFAEVDLGEKNSTLMGISEIWIIVCEVRTTDVYNKPAKTLYIHEYRIDSITADEYEEQKLVKVECPFCHKKFNLKGSVTCQT